MRSDSVINTALLIGGVRHAKGGTLVPVMPCPIWEDALSDSRMATQHHVAASLARPALEQQTKSPLESRRERPVDREHRSPSTRAAFNFDRQSWMDDGWTAEAAFSRIIGAS